MGLFSLVCSVVLSANSNIANSSTPNSASALPVICGNAQVNQVLSNLDIGLGITDSVTKQCTVSIRRMGLFHVMSIEDFEGNRNSVTLDTLIWRSTNSEFHEFESPTGWVFGPKRVWFAVSKEARSVAIDGVPCFLYL